MTSLVTLAVAKKHLKMSAAVVDRDVDVQRKSEQATAAILKYLKGRAHEGQATALIDTSSVASPTVITTLWPHGLMTGDVAFISGHRDSVPPVNGTWTATVLSTTTFTIPVAVTTDGSGGSVSLTWTLATVPGEVQAAILVLLTHLVEHPGDELSADAETWEAIGRLLAQARDPAFA